MTILRTTVTAILAPLLAMGCMAAGDGPAAPPVVAVSDGHMPGTVAGVREWLAERSLRWNFREAPSVNVAEDDLPELLVGSVLVMPWAEQVHHRGRRSRSLLVEVFAADGQLHTCFKHHPGLYRVKDWTADTLAGPDGLAWPAMVAQFPRPGYVPVPQAYLYDAGTGETVQFIYSLRKHMWSIWPGHLQRRLPAAVHDICPDFPSAQSLGLEVNPAQTSHYYGPMLEQHPGDRVLRPDLVTPDAEMAGRP